MPTLTDIAARLRQPDVTLTKLNDGSGVLLDLPGHQVLALNETGLFLLESLRGADDQVTAGRLQQTLLDEFDVDGQTAERDITAFLAELEGLFTQD